jgi:serine/threonine protein kinase
VEYEYHFIEYEYDFAVSFGGVQREISCFRVFPRKSGPRSKLVNVMEYQPRLSCKPDARSPPLIGAPIPALLAMEIKVSSGSILRMAIESLDSPPVLADYEQLVEIARGGMGVVYRGLHKKTQRYDAIKVMRPDRLVGTAHDTLSLLRLQFLRESQLAARVAHEHIVPVYQVGETDDRPWFSMQLVDGRSLHEIARDKALAPERIVCYVERIARAVDVVHRHGILHGDIKPQNILIESHSDRPMISDFGLAWSLFAVGLALMPWAPVLFGAMAAITCLVTATMDPSFGDN